MSASDYPEIVIEPERYEFRAASPYRFEVDRREFFRVLGCGLVVLFVMDTALAQPETGVARRGGRGGGQRPTDIGAWIHIGEDGTVTVFTGKAEVGQNIRTSMTQAVAEELRTPFGSAEPPLHAPFAPIKLVMADTDLVPFDAGTFGSRSTPDMAAQLHRVGAAAREALLDLAADYFKTDRASLKIADGLIINTSADGVTNNASKGTMVTFGQLTKGQKLVKSVNNQSATTPAADWKIAGTSVPKVNGRSFVTGKHQYASDITRPGMLHGKVLRGPAFGATLTSVDTKAVEAMPSVTVVHDGDFVGVAAPDVLQAEKAIAAIKAEWAVKKQVSSTEIFDYLKKNVRGGRGGGGAEAAAADTSPDTTADHKLQQTYTVAYIAHTPLEPRAAVAEWQGDKLTVWTGTQGPFRVRGDLAQDLGIGEDRVHVIVPDTGSGYGGKHRTAAATEAARLAKATGKPVKLVWTREEEFKFAYFRPAGVIDVKSGMTKDGVITDWEFHNYNSGNSGIRSPYDISGQKTQFHNTSYPLEQGSYRGLAATANHFAREVHMDELARLAKLDPLEFRRKNLKDERLRAVLEAAAKAFGWGNIKASEGRGFGIACGTEKGSYLATCAEVVVDREAAKIKVVRAVSAFECGAIVNPDHLKNQVEGALVMGLGGALFESIEFANGEITNPHLSDYRVPRFTDAPAIEVVLLDRKDLPSAGAGETPIIGIAPAISNAVFDATGIRLRSMPMMLG